MFDKLKGSKNSWGLIAKVFHWLMALFLFIQVCVGINLHYLNSSVLKGELIYFHKVFGTFILLLVFLRLVWKFYNPSPFNGDMSPFHKLTSNFVHIFLYLLIFLIPIQGMFLSWLGGSDVFFLGIIKFPRFIEEDFILHEKILNFHFTMTLVLIVFFLIHLLGSLIHIFIYKDKYKVWKRMKMF